ncbi:uncharacterized protein LOC131245571 [Magnolia sinica]|uniref:uncharacterized protein LOC131245571 n=1 Tax=Magnolia sinica TaxID=86752 RepID=UPI00265B11DC|nr:uncharacterized protein LOC131245571 [Magnolia sinica]
MASMPSESWDSIVEDVPVIDGSLLMDLLEESQVDETEDERLGCVIRSLEAEIDGSGPITAECGLESAGSEDGQDWSRSTSQIDDPFDWVDMDMVSGSHCGDIGNWYLDTCTDEIGMAGFGDVRDYSHLYYGDYPMEQVYSPLWQETYDSPMDG